MKVKATKEFNDYRCNVLGLDKKDFRALQAGKVVEVKSELVKKYPQIFKVDKGVKDGDK